MNAAEELLRVLQLRGETLAVAESLTGGLVTAALTAVPGASEVVRGGVVTYATDLKASALGVDEGLLARGGPVQLAVAEQMAQGVATWSDATWGLATTGVAGPGPVDGHPAGTVFVAVAGPGGRGRRSRAVPGLVRRATAGAGRDEIRAAAVRDVVTLALEAVEGFRKELEQLETESDSALSQAGSPGHRYAGGQPERRGHGRTVADPSGGGHP